MYMYPPPHITNPYGNYSMEGLSRSAPPTSFPSASCTPIPSYRYDTTYPHPLANLMSTNPMSMSTNPMSMNFSTTIGDISVQSPTQWAGPSPPPSWLLPPQHASWLPSHGELFRLFSNRQYQCLQWLQK